MNKKKIWRLFASTLATSIALNMSPTTTKAVVQKISTSLANNSNDSKSVSYNKSEGGDSSEKITDVLDISAEQMQMDFEQSIKEELEKSNLDNNVTVSLSNNSYARGNVAESDKYVYFSDLFYDYNESTIFMLNGMAGDRSSIQLDIEGEGVKEFKKGGGLRASGFIIYDISKYTDTKPILHTYLGINHSQAINKNSPKADGCTVKFYTSNDKSEWKQIGEDYKLEQGGIAKYINLNIKDTKYIKIEVDGHAYSDYDYVSFGDFRLMEDGYNIDDEIVSNISFSFTGDNAGKIVVETTGNGDIGYSLDGGKNWTPINVEISSDGKRYINLNKKEIESINAENDIKVKIGIYEYTVDIKASNDINANNFYLNDEENRLLGTIDNLEYSTDEGENWHDYTSETRIYGDTSILLRRKANGLYAPSKSITFSFKQDTDTNIRKYVSISDIALEAFCSEQSSSLEHAAKNLIDGNPNTYWHNNYNGDTDKFYTVKFNELKYITSLEYLPRESGVNGRWKSGKVYTSFDGKEWTEVASFNNLANDANLKTINIEKPRFTRYIKVVATETYGSNGTLIGGRMLKFFEDSTKVYSDEAVVRYSTTEETNNYVIAELILPEGAKADELKHKFTSNGSYTFRYIDKNGKQKSVEAVVKNISRDESKDYFYLSDIEYEKKQSIQGWNGIIYDKNPAGNTISLLIDGDSYNFNKGIGAHASSTIFYDIEAFSTKYNIFSAYLGVDYSQKNNGGSVSFVISASKDGENWDTLKETEVLSAKDNSVYVNLDVSGYKYLKLKADSGLNNSNDHSVYAEARLVKPDYNISSERAIPFNKLSEYDKIISSRTVEENYNYHIQEVYEREFVNRIGYSNLVKAKLNLEGIEEVFSWLKEDSEAMKLLIEAGAYLNGDGYNVLTALNGLYSKHKEDLNVTIYKKMMIATAAANSRRLMYYMEDFSGNASSADPVERYEIMKKLYDNNMFSKKSEFESYPMELIRLVMGTKLPNEEIEWLNNYLDRKYGKNYKDIYTGMAHLGPYGTNKFWESKYYDVNNYATYNEKYQLDGTPLALGEEKGYSTDYPRSWMLIDGGGICWAQSGLGVAANGVKGIAALNTFQPRHQAEIAYYTDAQGRGCWRLGYDIYGWQSSFTSWYGMYNNEIRIPLQWGTMDFNNKRSGNNTTYILLAQDALNNYENYIKSMNYNLISNSYEKGSSEYYEALEKSLSYYDKNVDAVYNLIKAYKEDSNNTEEGWRDFGYYVTEKFKFFPVPMVDLTNLILNNINESNMKAEIITAKTVSLKRATEAKSTDTTQHSICVAVAKSLLGENSIELATFSFDGEDAGKIKLNDYYKETGVSIRVSLDGGENWLWFEDNNEIYTTKTEIQLTEEQIASLTSENDILIGLRGSGFGNNYVIDLKDGISSEGLYVNDNENLLLGNTSGLEYSLDDGVTWHDYESGLESDTRIDGQATVSVRRKAQGVYLAGEIAKYNFNENEDTEECKYIQLRYIELNSFSTDMPNKNNQAANFIDGLESTVWHTKWDYTDEEKEYSIKFDTVKYVKRIDYLPTIGGNGRMKSGEIYTSIDGETWNKVYSFNNLKNDSNKKTIVLDEAVEAKYIKLKATETYGNSNWENNKYFSGRMLELYEDTTKKYSPKAEIKYSINEFTNEDVIATIKLPDGCKLVEGSPSEYRFTTNDKYIFNYVDANGKEHSAEASVTWIDKVPPTAEVSYNITTVTGIRVRA